MTTTRRGWIAKRIIQNLEMIEILNPDYLKLGLDYMDDYVYTIYASMRFLEEPPVIFCLS